MFSGQHGKAREPSPADDLRFLTLSSQCQLRTLHERDGLPVLDAIEDIK